MKLVSKASMREIKNALISAYTATIQDVTDEWKMSVSTFTIITDSLIRISSELGVDLIPAEEKQFEFLESQAKSAEIRLKAAKELQIKPGEP